MNFNFDFLLIFLRFSSPGGACRPGLARETERADLGSCDSRGFFEDYGVNSCLMLLTVAYGCFVVLFSLLSVFSLFSCFSLFSVFSIFFIFSPFSLFSPFNSLLSAAYCGLLLLCRSVLFVIFFSYFSLVSPCSLFSLFSLLSLHSLFSRF